MIATTPEQFRELAAEIDEVFNENVEYGYVYNRDNPI